MKRTLLKGFLYSSFILLTLGFVACSSGNSYKDSDGESADTNSGTNASSEIGITFNLTSAKALAGTEGSSAKSARAGDSEVNSPLVKILADGSVESAITVPEGMNLSPVVAVIQPPKGTSDDVYVIFSSSSYFWSEGYWDEENDVWVDGKEFRISQMICVHPDGTWDDVLGTDDGTYKYLWCYDSDYTTNFKFDDNGNLYYLCSESSGYQCASVFYQYNPKTKENEQLTAAVQNYWYESFSVASDGSYIFVYGSKDSDRFLRAIPIDDPDNAKNISYGSWNIAWCYDEENNCVYLCEENSTNKNGETVYGGLSKISLPSMKKTFIKQNVWIPSGYDENDVWHDWVDENYNYYNLAVTKDGLYGSSSYWSSSSNSLIKILDADRNFVGTECTIPDNFEPIAWKSGNGELYVSCNILDEDTGSKTGYQTILRAGDSFTNMFENVQKNVELVSWSIGSDSIFYCGVRGRSVNNGKINVTTLDHELINSGLKFTCLVALY